jgi:hypothetical protein
VFLDVVLQGQGLAILTYWLIGTHGEQRNNFGKLGFNLFDQANGASLPTSRSQSPQP